MYSSQPQSSLDFYFSITIIHSFVSQNWHFSPVSAFFFQLLRRFFALLLGRFFCTLLSSSLFSLPFVPLRVCSCVGFLLVYFRRMRSCYQTCCFSFSFLSWSIVRMLPGIPFAGHGEGFPTGWDHFWSYEGSNFATTPRILSGFMFWTDKTCCLTLLSFYFLFFILWFCSSWWMAHIDMTSSHGCDNGSFPIANPAIIPSYLHLLKAHHWLFPKALRVSTWQIVKWGSCTKRICKWLSTKNDLFITFHDFIMPIWSIWPAFIHAEKFSSIVQVAVRDYSQLYCQTASKHWWNVTGFPHNVSISSIYSYRLLVTIYHCVHDSSLNCRNDLLEHYHTRQCPIFITICLGFETHFETSIEQLSLRSMTLLPIILAFLYIIFLCKWDCAP